MTHCKLFFKEYLAFHKKILILIRSHKTTHFLNSYATLSFSVSELLTTLAILKSTFVLKKILSLEIDHAVTKQLDPIHLTSAVHLVTSGQMIDSGCW